MAAGAGILTLVVSVLSLVNFAYRGPAMHVALETTGALVLLLSTYLVLGRLHRSAERFDLALFSSLTVLALSNLFFSAIPATVGGGRSSFSTWATLLATLVAGASFAFAASVPPGRLRRPRRAEFQALAGCLVALGTIAVCVALLASELPRGFNPALRPEGLGSLGLQGNRVVGGAQLVTAGLFGFAAWRFTRRAEQTGDELLRWLAAGLVLAAFARLNYFLFPSRYSEWIYTGDILRFGFQLALLTGAALEIGAHQRGLAQAAVLEERRRVARQLHDGLAQELAFIVTQARRLASKRADDKTLAHLATAGEQALAESRHAITVLSNPSDEPLDVSVARVADEIADRAGLALELDLKQDLHVSAPTHQALLRILREAMTNAARHGEARTIAVALSCDDGVRLRVADDGVGFEPNAPRTPWRSVGLRSMRERAEALGGELRIDSAPGSGARIEVVLP